MDTPPYSDISAQLSPGAHSAHANGDTSHAVAHPNGGLVAPPSAGNASNDQGHGHVDIRALYSTSWTALESASPPTLREILTAYKQKGDGDRDMLLAMLNAKTAEDQRIASQLSLRRSMLEINKYSAESRLTSHSHIQYPHTTQSYGGHTYTYVPEEPYTSNGAYHQQRLAPASPPAPPHTYSPGYSSAHSQASRSHAHLRTVESPPLSAATQKSVLSTIRTRAPLPRSHSRGVRLSDTRSQMHVVTQPQSQMQAPSHSQSIRRKRARHSRSRSRSPIPVASTSSSQRPYTYTYSRSPPTYSNSASRSHAQSEVDPEAERSPYSSASASEAGSPRGHAISTGHVQGQSYPRTMAIGSLLSAGAKANVNAVTSASPGSSSRLNGSGTNGVVKGTFAAGRIKDELAGRDQEMERDNLEHDEAQTTRERDRRERQDGQDER